MQSALQKIQSLVYYGCCTAIVLAVLGLVLLYFFQNNIIYMPTIPGLGRYPHQNPPAYRNPKAQGLQYHDINIDTPDGVQLHGWFIPSKNQKTSRTVIYLHENAGSTVNYIGTRIPYLKTYVRATDSNLVLVAYRGFSNSGGVPTQNGIKIDGAAILRYVREKLPDIDKDKVYLHGRSLGGAVAIHVSSNSPWGHIRGVILQNTFTSMADMVDVVFGRLRHIKHLLLKNHWKSVDEVGKIKAPVLFIKGNSEDYSAALDQLVPLQHMNKLAEVARSNGIDVSEYLMETATHNQTWDLDPEGYFGRVLQFFTECQSSTMGIRHAKSMSKDTVQL